jgi:chromosome segregation ATPase
MGDPARVARPEHGAGRRRSKGVAAMTVVNAGQIPIPILVPNSNGGHTMTDRQAYIDKAKARLDQWEADIDKLKAKLDEAGADAKIEYADQIKKLGVQRDEAVEKLKTLRDSGDDVWDDVKEGLETAWERVEKAWKDAKTKIG